jgi:hypothetical protein
MKLVRLAMAVLLVSCAGRAPSAAPGEEGEADGGGGGAEGGATGTSGAAPAADGGAIVRVADSGAGVAADVAAAMDRAGADGGARDSVSSAPADASNAPAGNASCTTLHYCEGFESYTLGTMPGAPWTRSTGGGAAMKVDGTRPFSGTKSLHVTAPAGEYSHAYITQKMGAAVPVSGPTLYGRVMFYFNDQAPYDLPKGSVHSWIFNVSGSSAAGPVSMNLGGWGVPKVMLNYHWTGKEDALQGAPWKAGAWHCLQWQYDGSGTPAKNEARVWVDGVLALTINGTTGGASHVAGWNMAPPWTSIDLGFTHYQTLTNQVEVWLDDFALDSAMVACPSVK